MPARLDISDFKCFNQLRNGADFSANTSEFASALVGNVGEKVKVSYKATFNYFSNAEIGNSWSVKVGKITRANGNYQTDDSLVIGDVITFFADWANNDTAAPEFTANITGFADGGKTVLFGVTSGSQVTTGNNTNVGFICDPNASGNVHTAMINRFGLVPNDDDYSNSSLVSDNSQSYSVVGMTGITAPITGTADGIYKDWVTGSITAFIESIDVANYTVTYQVDHIFIISPSYIVGYLDNLQNGTAPDFFAGDNSLKYAFELNLRKTKTDTATNKAIVFDTLIGSVGWFNENFNGGLFDYSATTTYQDTATTEIQTALQINRKTTATILVSKASAPFSAGQVLTAYVQYLPLNESGYIDTATDYQDNFLYDTIRVVEGTGDVVGTGIIKRANARLLSSDNISLELDIEYTSAQGLRISNGNFLLAVSCEDSTLLAGNSDRVMVLADVQQYQAIGLISGLLTFDKFDLLVHNQVLGVDTGSIFAQVWNEDGLLLDFGFSLELAQQAFIDELAIKLVAFKSADESYFELDRHVIDCSDFVVSDGSQQLEVDTTRGYNLADDDQFNFVKLTTGAKVGTVQSYTGSFGQKITWQDWLANTNADSVFFDNTKLNNNLNQKASNYSGLDRYTIKIIAEATLTGVDDFGNAGAGFERGEVEAITVNDYGVSDDGAFTDVDIQLLDAITEESLEGQIYNDTPTLFRSIFTASDTNTANVWAIHRLYERNAQGNNLIAELSSIKPYPTNNALLPITGQTQLYLYSSGGNIVTECLIDNNRIDPSKEYRLTARIDRASESLLFFTVFDSGVSGFLTAQITNIVTGAWTLGELIVSSNTLNTNSTFLDGEQKLIRYSASSFAGLTAIDIDDTQARGTLDLSLEAFTALLNVTAQGNQFDNVLFGGWVRTTLVDIDLTNSIISVDVLGLIIDNLIIANGGTTTDDGVSYTGSAGVTSAGRLLAVGTITIDVTTTGILYEKIIALESVGWTITTILTICDKTLLINTGAQSFASGFINKTRSLISLDFISGDPLTVKLYDTEANAVAGSATGLLADGYTAFDAYVRDDANYNAWVNGTVKGIRFEVLSGASTNNISNFRYKSVPSSERPCGESSLITDPLAGNAPTYDGAFDYFKVNNWVEKEWSDPFTVVRAIKNINLSTTIIQFIQGTNGAPGGGYVAERGIAFVIVSNGAILFQMLNNSTKRLRLSTAAGVIQSNTEYIIIIESDGSGLASGIRLTVNGIDIAFSVLQDNLGGNTILQPTVKTIIVAARPNGGGFQILGGFQDKIFDIIPRVLTDTERLAISATADTRNITKDLSIDYDKTSGYPTDANFTISGFGGFVYTPYL